MNSQDLGTGFPSVGAIAAVPVVLDESQTRPMNQDAKDAKPRHTVSFDVPEIIDADRYLQDLSDALARQHGCQAWVAIVDAAGKSKKLSFGEAEHSGTPKISDESLESIAVESYASSSPIISGFPLVRLNTSSLILEQSRQRGGLASIFAFSAKFAALPGGVVIILGWDSQSSISYPVINGMMEHSKGLAQTIEQSELCRLGMRLLTWQRALWEWSPSRLRWAAAVAVIGIVLMWIPVPYYPKRVCVIQPASRTYVSSPIDGFLDQAYVRPGDRVEAHALLARLDEKNLLRELSSARAEYEAAQKRQDRALSTKSGGDLRIAQLEQDQIALKIQTLESNLEKLEARSLAAGIVVQGDWQGSEGASLTTGQTLFEIAPLDVMTIEVHIKPEDLAWCKTGTSVTVHSESSVGRSWNGTIERIDPAAETENDEAYFVAELQVENQDGTLRPGMKGLARLHGGRRSIGWLLFHSPYQWFVHQWVW